MCLSTSLEAFPHHLLSGLLHPSCRLGNDPELFPSCTDSATDDASLRGFWFPSHELVTVSSKQQVWSPMVHQRNIAQKVTERVLAKTDALCRHVGKDCLATKGKIGNTPFLFVSE